MKKALLTTAILLAFVLGGVAQPGSFAPQGAEWYFNVGTFMNSPITYYRMAVEGDTLIQGHTCSVITQPFFGGNGDEQYVYEENRKVYWYNQTLQAFTTLYDFDAEVGDTWICDIDSCSFEIQVQSVDEVTWEGHTYRVQHVYAIGGDEYYNSFFYTGEGTIIEGIGEINGLFPYPGACIGEIYCGNSIDYLRCYLVDGELLYHYGSYDCDQQSFCWDGTVAEAYAGGDGTAENPYQIATSEQLALLAQQTNNGMGDIAYYELTANINLQRCDGGTQPWTSIGTETNMFMGHFNGNGNYVLYVNQYISDGDVQPVGGLFGYTDRAEISNVNLVQCSIRGKGQYVGGLVGYAGMTDIINCSIGQSSVMTEEGVAGGLVGCADVPFGMSAYQTDVQPYYVTNCLTDLANTIEGSICVGGIVGQVNKDDGRMPCVITNCTVRDRNHLVGWSVTSDGFAGGIVGWFRNGSITGCLNQYVVNGGEFGVGGIAGEANNATIENCTNEGEVHGTHSCGGVVGRSEPFPGIDLNIYDCTNEGNVTCEETEAYQMAGGILGSGASRVIRCVNKGNVTGYTDYGTMLGGIVGADGGTIANCYNRGTVRAAIEEPSDSLSYVIVGGITGGPSARVFNVYNTMTVVAPETALPATTLTGFGQIVGYETNVTHYLNTYWFGSTHSANGNPDCPDLPGSSGFWRSYDSLFLMQPQYGTTDLIEALNFGAAVVLDSVPEYPYLTTWLPDTEGINIGYPVLGPNSVGDEALNAYCEAPMNFGGSPIFDQGTYGAQLWWNKPFASHWFHYDEKPYAGSVYCNYWGIKIPAEEIEAGDVLTHVAFYKAGGQNQTMAYSFAFGFEGETEPDSWDYLPGNSVQVEPGPDEWVMVKLGNPIVCEEGKCLWIVLEAPNVEGNNAAYCQASGNLNACWSSNGNAVGDWMIRGYFTNDVGYNDPGYNEDLDHYNIYRGSSLDELEKIAEVGRDEEEYFDTLQQPFGDYYYQLTASYTDGRESVPARRGENPHDPDFVYFHVGNISSLGSEWYYEIQNENGSTTYQHLEYAADTTVNNKDVKIIIRTNTLYDKGEHSEVTREYIYEDFGKVYWWNETRQDFTLLYDLGAQIGDEWEIKVGTESLTMHVDTVEQYDYEGTTYRMLRVSDAGDLFSGTIISGIGHLTSFFPERMMTRGKNFRVEGIRCYWVDGELVFKQGDKDCDEVYEELHHGINEPVENQFNIYPNPTRNVLVVETHGRASQQVETYRITNLMGQTLMSGTIIAENQRIDVSKLPQGMYFISIGDLTRKFVVNR